MQGKDYVLDRGIRVNVCFMYTVTLISLPLFVAGVVVSEGSRFCYCKVLCIVWTDVSYPTLKFEEILKNEFTTCMYIHFVVCTLKWLSPTTPLGSMYLNHSCTYKQILALKVILKSLSSWYLAQAGERQIILNFLIVLGQK